MDSERDVENTYVQNRLGFHGRIRSILELSFNSASICHELYSGAFMHTRLLITVSDKSAYYVVTKISSQSVCGEEWLSWQCGIADARAARGTDTQNETSASLHSLLVPLSLPLRFPVLPRNEMKFLATSEDAEYWPLLRGRGRVSVVEALLEGGGFEEGFAEAERRTELSEFGRWVR